MIIDFGLPKSIRWSCHESVDVSALRDGHVTADKIYLRNK